MNRLRPPRLAPLLALLLCAAHSSPAASQPRPAGPTATPAPTASPAEEADTLYREALVLAKAGDWPKAYQKLLHAFQLKKSFDIATNLGAVEYNLTKYTDAAEHLRYGLSIFPPNAKPELKKASEEVYAKARAQVATVQLMVNPADADVKIGGRAIPLDQRAEVFVQPGDIVVEAGAKGHEPYRETVNALKNWTMHVRVTLKPVGGAGPTASTTATVAPTSVPVSAGPNKVLLGTGIGLTAVALGVGIGLLVGSADKAGEARDLQAELLAQVGRAGCAPPSPAADCNKHVDAARTSDTLGNAGAATLIGAGLAGAGTLIYGLVTRPRVTSAVQASVSVGPQGGALTLQGRF
jgi:hypothetical protein